MKEKHRRLYDVLICSFSSSWLFGCSNSSFTHSVDECEATRIDKHANEELENSMQVCFLFSFLTCLYSTPHPLRHLALLHSDGCFCDLKNVLHRKIWRIFFFLVFVERTTSVSTVTMCAEEMCECMRTPNGYDLRARKTFWLKTKSNGCALDHIERKMYAWHFPYNVCSEYNVDLRSIKKRFKGNITKDQMKLCDVQNMAKENRWVQKTDSSYVSS